MESQSVEDIASSLTEAGVGYSFRKAPPTTAQLAAGGEIDLYLPESEFKKADEVLRSAGYRRLTAPGHWSHRFFLAHEGGRWIKLDIKLERRTQFADSRIGGFIRRMDAQRPASIRRLGPVVAFIGPDGSGKGTVIDALRILIPIGVTVAYFGRKRAVGSGPSGERSNPSGPREVAFVCRRAVRTWWRLGRVYRAAWRGSVVLCDRHPLETLVVQPQRHRLAARLENLLLTKLVPEPDAIVVLDAEVSTLLERKQEHPEETLERWRQAYRRAFAGRRSYALSTEGTVSDTVAAASSIVWHQLSTRRRW